MREFKYQNESGSKKGNWFLNRFDYFEFYGFEGMAAMQFRSVIMCIAYMFVLAYADIWLVLLLLWPLYVAVVTLFLLQQKRCKYRGYFLFPKRIIQTLKVHQKEVDPFDFDSIASLENVNLSKGFAQHKYNQRK